jgi:hypothetical protein
VGEGGRSECNEENTGTDYEGARQALMASLGGIPIPTIDPVADAYYRRGYYGRGYYHRGYARSYARGWCYYHPYRC